MFKKQPKAVTSTSPNVILGKGTATDESTPVAQYGLPQVSYSTDDLEIHEPGTGTVSQMPTVGKASSPRNLLAFSRRKAMMVSVAITVLVMLLTGITMVALTRKSSKSDQSAQNAAQSQDISLKNADLSVLPVELQGANRSLAVNGDLVTTGTLKFSNNTFVSILKTDTSTANQTYTLPNASGTICLDSNNCNYVTTAALETVTNTQTLTLPQNLTTTGSPQFTSLSLTTLTPNAVVYNNGAGSLASLVATAPNQCLLSTAGAPVFGGCSNGSVASVNSFTGVVSIVQGSGITVSNSAGTITINSALGNDVDLTSSEVSGTLPIANGGTGANTRQGALDALTGFTATGDLLYYNGTNAVSLAKGTNGQCLQSNVTTILWSNCTAGVTAIGVIDSQTPDANGAVIVGTSIYLQSASATAPGLVNASSQIFAGEKTFINDLFVRDASNNVVLYVDTSDQASGSQIVGSDSSFEAPLAPPTNTSNWAILGNSGLAISSTESRSGSQSLEINTSPSLVTTNNETFETLGTGSNTSDWVTLNGSTLTVINAQSQMGAQSLQFDTTNVANDGVKYPVALASSTTYVFSVYLKSGVGSGVVDDLVIGRRDDASDTNCSTSNVTIEASWTQYTCTFTTGTTNGANSNVYIKRLNTALGAGVTIYVDSISLTPVVTNTGAKYPLALNSNTTYTYSVFLKLSTGNATDIVLGHRDDASDLDCANSRSATSTSWTQYTCTFTTGTTNGANSNVYIKRLNTAAGPGIVVYADDIQLRDNSGSKLVVGDSVNGTLGQLQLSSNAGGNMTIQASPSGSGNYILVLPSENGTICTDSATSACLTKNSSNTYIQFAPSSGQIDNSTDPNHSTIWVANNTGEGNILRLQGWCTDTIACPTPSIQDALVLQGDGDMYFRSLQSSDSAFQIRGATNNVLLNIGTASSTNLISNQGFESAILPWIAFGCTTNCINQNPTISPPPTISQNSLYAYEGTKSLELQNNGGTGNGKVGVYYPIDLEPNTTYAMSFYAAELDEKIGTVKAGYYQNLTPEDQASNMKTCGSTMQIVTRITDSSPPWSRFTCTFTTGTSGPGGIGASGIYIFNNTGTSNYMLDKVILQKGTTTADYNGQYNVFTPATIQSDNGAAFLVTGSLGESLNINTMTSDYSIGLHTYQDDDDNSQFGNFNILDSTGNDLLKATTGNVGSLSDWTRPSYELPVPIFQTQATTATYGNSTFAYLVGGTNGGVATTQTQYASISTNGTSAWNLDTLHPLPTALQEHAVGSYRNYIYALGGNDGGGNLGTWYDNVYMNQIDTDGSLKNDWLPAGVGNLDGSAGSHMLSPRSNFETFIYNGYIYAIGGQTCNSGACTIGSIEYAQIRGDGTLGAWVSVAPTYNLSHIASERRNFAIAIHNNTVFVVGGQSSSGTEKTVLYNTLSDTGDFDNIWQPTTEMPSTRANHTAAFYGNYMYVFGGNGDAAKTNSTYAFAGFDPVTGGVGDFVFSDMFDGSSNQNLLSLNKHAMVTLGNMFFFTPATGGGQGKKITYVTARESSNAVKINGSLSVTTGGTYGGALTVKTSTDSFGAFVVSNSTDQDVLKVDTVNSSITLGGLNSPDFSTWVNTGTINNGVTTPFGIEGNSSVFVNGYLYSISGTNGANGTPIVNFARVNTDGSIVDNSWTNTTPLPDYMIDAGVVSANGYIYVLGGFDSGGVTNKVYVGKPNSDGTINQWKLLSSTLNTAVGSPAVTLYNGYLYVMGGATSFTGGAPPVPGSPTNTVQYAQIRPDGTLGLFSTATAVLPDTDGIGADTGFRMGARATTANGNLYVTGGDNALGATNSTAYARPNIATGDIATWNTTTGQFPDNRAYHSSIVANGYLYVVAGTNTTFNSGDTNTLQYGKITSTGDITSWATSANTLFGPTSNHGTAYSNGYLYVVGGHNELSTVQFASSARVQVGGSLDLVGIGSQTLSDAGGGGQLTAGNTTIVGTLDVRDSANFTQSLSVDGSFAAHGLVLLQNNANSAEAFAVQDATGISVFGIDTSASIVNFGTPNILDGIISMYQDNSAFRGFFRLSGTALTADQTYTLPTTGGGICVVEAANCSSSLQASYTISTGGTTPEIKLDATRNGVDIQDSDTTIGPSENLLNVRASNGAGLGQILFGVGNTGKVIVQNSADSANALQVKNFGDQSVLNVNTSAGQLELGSANTLAGKLIINDGGSTFGVTLQTGTLTNNRTYSFPNSTSATDTICLLTRANCVGTGGGVTSSGGTTNRISKFSGSTAISDSNISDDGSVVAIFGSNGLAVGVNNSITGAIRFYDVNTINSVVLQPTNLSGGTYSLTIPDGGGSNQTICTTYVGTCFGAGSGATLQAAYDAGRTINTSEARDLDITLADSLTTDSKLTVNIAGTGNTIEFQDGGTPFVTFADGGATTFSPTNNSATAFLITNNTPTALFTADTLNMKIKIGTGTPTLGASTSGALFVTDDAEFAGQIRIGDNDDNITVNATTKQISYSGSARQLKTVQLHPEYAGYTLDGSGIGTLTSSFCSGTARLNVNANVAGGCGNATEEQNFYTWTTSQGTSQSYDMYVRYRIPSDFSDFENSTSIQMYGWRSSVSGSIQLAMYNGAAAQCGSTTEISTTNNTWIETPLTGDETALAACQAIVSDDIITFKITYTATNGNYARAGAIRFTYLSKF